MKNDCPGYLTRSGRAEKLHQEALHDQYEIYKKRLSKENTPVEFEEWVAFIKDIIRFDLAGIYRGAGISQPSNADEIERFVLDDLIEVTGLVAFHSGNVAIAFRRFLESI